VIVVIDGFTRRMSEGELIGRILQNHPPGDKVKVTLLRGQEKMKIVLPVQ